MEKKVNDKRLTKISNECNFAHGKLQGKLKQIKNCEEEAKVLFQLSLKWPNYARIIKDKMDSIESQIAQDSSVYDLVSNANGVK